MKRAKIGDCCDWMRMTIERSHPDKREGMCLESVFSLRSGGETRKALILWFPKKRGQHNEASHIYINYCPFCGVKAKESKP